MALTRTFRETVYRRAQRDSAFRKALLSEAVNAYLGGDEATGRAVLRDVINTTMGFEPLGTELGKPPKSPAPHAGSARKPQYGQLLRDSPSVAEEGRCEVDREGCIGMLLSARDFSARFWAW